MKSPCYLVAFREKDIELILERIDRACLKSKCTMRFGGIFSGDEFSGAVCALNDGNALREFCLV